ncbi:MAG: aromatic-ring-hydroxylating dioxygenase subunit beta [Immundisolibacteraceae bacterium]|nr:aromatic-ring-hydroxylating dioxygenase subunit beta [Immundisolibacteraceae bacterium]
MTTIESTIDLALRAMMEDFLYEEALMLDEKRYADWVDLFSEDAIYWVPANNFDNDPSQHVSLIYDNYSRLKERLTRMQHPYFWSQDPPSRTSRLIGNVRVLESEGDEVLVESRFQMLELRRQTRHFAGTCHHRLVNVDDSWKIRRKTVYLINNNEHHSSLTFLL